MNEPEPKPNPREQDEMQVMSLLLGELGPQEAKAIRKKLESDPSLAAYADELQMTLGLVREAALNLTTDEPKEETSFQLDTKRRDAVLKAFKTPIREVQTSRKTHSKLWQILTRSSVAFGTVLIIILILSPILSNLTHRSQRINAYLDFSSSESAEGLEPATVATDAFAMEGLEPNDVPAPAEAANKNRSLGVVSQDGVARDDSGADEMKRLDFDSLQLAQKKEASRMDDWTFGIASSQATQTEGANQSDAMRGLQGPGQPGRIGVPAPSGEPQENRFAGSYDYYMGGSGEQYGNQWGFQNGAGFGGGAGGGGQMSSGSAGNPGSVTFSRQRSDFEVVPPAFFGETIQMPDQTVANYTTDAFVAVPSNADPFGNSSRAKDLAKNDFGAVSVNRFSSMDRGNMTDGNGIAVGGSFQLYGGISNGLITEVETRDSGLKESIIAEVDKGHAVASPTPLAALVPTESEEEVSTRGGRLAGRPQVMAEAFGDRRKLSEVNQSLAIIPEPKPEPDVALGLIEAPVASTSPRSRRLESQLGLADKEVSPPAPAAPKPAKSAPKSVTVVSGKLMNSSLVGSDSDGATSFEAATPAPASKLAELGDLMPADGYAAPEADRKRVPMQEAKRMIPELQRQLSRESARLEAKEGEIALNYKAPQGAAVVDELAATTAELKDDKNGRFYFNPSEASKQDASKREKYAKAETEMLAKKQAPAELARDQAKASTLDQWERQMEELRAVEGPVAQQSRNELEQLTESRVIAEREADYSKAKLATARAELERAQQNRSQATIEKLKREAVEFEERAKTAQKKLKLIEQKQQDLALGSIAKMPNPTPKPELVPAPSRPKASPRPEVETSVNAFSTFSLNVSDVSFKLAKASLDNRSLPEKASVRSEEFINAMEYHDPAPAQGERVAFAWDHANNPFSHNRDLIRFSVQTAAAGREAGQPLNLVLLLDNSGSMERPDRVSIVRNALAVLAQKLTPQDRISVVTFARTARLWVDGMQGGQPQQLLQRLGHLTPEGGTNLEAALKLAYETAQKHFDPRANNRVILLTDGAANLGDVKPESLKLLVDEQRKNEIATDGFGVGWDGYNDELLETITRNGDGRYGFLNDPQQAPSEFARMLAGALTVAASNVKAQVEFNPDRVQSWRQIGYETHQLTKEQFRDNTVDAAEIAAKEAGTALYSIQVKRGGRGPIGTVRLRYKIPATGQYVEESWSLPYTTDVPELEDASPAIRVAAVSSAFAEWLAGSPHAVEMKLSDLQGFLGGISSTWPNDLRIKELASMVQQARVLAGQ